MHTATLEARPSKSIIMVVSLLFSLSQISAGALAGGSLAPASLLFFLALFSFFRYRPSFKALDSHTKWLLTALLSAAVVALPHFLIEWHSTLLDVPSRYLLAAIILLCFASYPIPARAFFVSAIIAGLVLGLVASYQYLLLDYNRASGSTNNAIVFGFISTSVMFSALLAGFYFSRHPIWRWLALISVSLSALACILSGARGAWIAVPPASILLIYLAGLRRLHAITWCTFLFICALLAYTQISLVSDRTDLAISETINYIKGSNAVVSVGLRFEMWKAAWLGFLENPLLGLGFAERATFYQQLAEQNIIWSEIIPSDGSDSAHNELLMTLVISGLIGLLSIIMLYVVPFRYYYCRYKAATTKESKFLSIAGLLLVTNYIIFGLTETPLHMDDTALYYGMTLVFIWICLIATQGSGTEDLSEHNSKITHGHP